MMLETLGQKGSFLTTVIGDFNVNCNNCNNHNKASSIDSIIFQFGLYQLTNESTYLLQNFSSCIGLIFTSQSNIRVKSGVYPFLHP